MIRIVGTTHLHQAIEPGFLVPPDIEREQKGRYRSLIDSLLAGPRGWFIGEEFTHGEETFASRHRQRHTYVNIDMPRERRDELGIPAGYADEGSPFSPEQIANIHRIRECYMFDRALPYCRKLS
jgi:hypothetical protein